MVHSALVMGRRSWKGVDVEMNVTDAPETTGFGAQSKLAVGCCATATPTPSGHTTAPTVAKHAANRNLT
jgi:hypothetical protein